MDNDGPLSSPDDDADDGAVIQARARLTTRLNRVINRFAERDDLILYCLWRPPRDGEAPAWFDPRAREVTLNAHVGLQGADPGEVNPLVRSGRRKHPEIIGLLAHEAAHAHSTDMSETAVEFRRQVHSEDPLLLEVLTLLEEPRIEYRQVHRRPHDRYYLRAQSVMIDLAPFSVDAAADTPELDRWRAAMVTLLIYGRVDAGILTSYDAEHVHPHLVSALGGEDLEKLREVQKRALVLDDGDLEGLLGCAREWLEVVGRPTAEIDLEDLLGLLAALFGCSGSGAASGGTEGSEWANEASDEEATSSGEAGDGSEGAGDVLSGIGAALKEITQEVATEVADEAAAQGADEAAHAAGKQNAEKKSDEAKKRSRQEKVAASVFDPDKGDSPTLKGARRPTADERRLAREVGQALRRAQFRDRTTTKYASPTPPGRLNGRDAMLGEAQKSMGNPVTARPFRTKRSRYAPEPPITLGLLADYSGSMGWASDALASVSWVFAHAMSYVTGTMASALFAEKVVPLTRPGQLPSQVQEYVANGGWENFGRAYDAINGALHLTRGTGVRLLVVLSDGQFVNADARTAREEALSDLKKSGVTVLWVGAPFSTDFPTDAIAVPLPVFETTNRGSETLTEVITQALAESLRSLR